MSKAVTACNHKIISIKRAGCKEPVRVGDDGLLSTIRENIRTSKLPVMASPRLALAKPLARDNELVEQMVEARLLRQAPMHGPLGDAATPMSKRCRCWPAHGSNWGTG